jgi:hypothetical protein
VAIVMARLSPMARVLSKNTVSPMPMAATIETVSCTKVARDIAVSVPGPSITMTTTRSSAPAAPERTALIVTEP